MCPGGFGQRGGSQAVPGLQYSDSNGGRHLHFRICTVQRPDFESSSLVHSLLRGGGQWGSLQHLHPVVLVPEQSERKLPALSSCRWSARLGLCGWTDRCFLTSSAGQWAGVRDGSDFPWWMIDKFIDFFFFLMDGWGERGMNGWIDRWVGQCSWLCTSVGKWCIKFYFDLQNVYLVCHHNAHFYQAHRQKVALWWNAIELSYDTTVSQLARVFSLARKQKVHVHLASAACFQNVKCHYFGDWTKGKHNLLSSSRVW